MIQVEKGVIYSDKGLPIEPRWFCDDRLSVKADRYGIAEIQYFNPATKGKVDVFVEDMFGGLKLYIDEAGRRSYMNLHEVEVLPYGFTALWKWEECTFRFEERLFHNSLYFSIEPVGEVRKELKFSMEFYESFGLVPHAHDNVRYAGAVERIWKQWEQKGDMLTVSYAEGQGETHVAIAGSTSLAHRTRDIGFKKHLVDFPILTGQKTEAVMAFDYSEERAFVRAKEAVAGSSTYLANQKKRYNHVMDTAPILISPYEELNRFVSLVPLYHESFKLEEYPGAIRARTNIYWAWGWDSMTSSFPYAYWGDVDFIGKMLGFFRDTADPVGGIAHSYQRDMSHGETSMVAAQGFYINLLYQYFINGGDVHPYYDFAKKIFQMIQDKEVEGLGLCSGMSLVPDFRELILENGHDLSCFNNTNAYAAVRSMEEIAKAIGDEETHLKASAFAQRARDNFNRVLFDEEAGFYVSSADSRTLEKRKVYMGMEVKWDNEFCRELVGETGKQCLDFYEKELVCKAGLRVFPVERIGWDADSNQAHCWWPAHSEHYSRLVNMADRRDLMEQFIGWISSWTALLMCPEGINCYVDTAEPYLDNWNAEPGIWQAFSMRAWYEVIVHSIVGVDLSREGVNFYPYSGEEMTLKGLHMKGRTVDVHMKGSGPVIEKVILNGADIGSVSRIPFEQLGERNEIVVIRRAV